MERRRLRHARERLDALEYRMDSISHLCLFATNFKFACTNFLKIKRTLLSAYILAMAWIESGGEYYNPFCSEPPFSSVTFDLSPCFQTTVVAAIPILVLVAFGLVEVFPLLRQRQAGIVLEKGGVDAFATKLVGQFRFIIDFSPSL